MSLTPEQLNALQSALSPSVEAAQQLGIPIDAVESFENIVKDFTRANHKEFKGKVYQFVLATNQSGTTKLDLTTIRDPVFQGKGLLHVDSDFRLIKTDTTLKNTTLFSKFLGQEKKLGFFIDGTYFWEVLCSRPLDEGDIVTGHNSLELSSSVPRRPMKDFDLLLQDHYDLAVRDEAGFCYWKNKTDRILLCGPHGTEWIFQHDLYDWLRKFAIDQLRVVAEPSGFGQDKHDITVVTETGTYVIEIKWLGKNEHGTPYGQTRIDEGLAQIGEYLKKDPSLFKGFLVTYDGRSLGDHKTKSSYKKGFLHSYCDTPKIIFLESENPSKKAERLVKEAK